MGEGGQFLARELSLSSDPDTTHVPIYGPLVFLCSARQWNWEF